MRKTNHDALEKNNMNIVMLLETPFPSDIRVENEFRSLAAAGHTIHLFCLGFDDKPDFEEFAKDIFLHRFKMNRWLFNKIHITILRWPFYNWIWQRYVKRQTASLRIDAVHVHDLPLAKVGLTIAGEKGIPFVLDLHENYPAALKAWKHSQTTVGRFFLNPRVWEKFEEEMVTAADGVIVVVEEGLERFRQKKIDESKFAVVSNTLNFEDFFAEEKLPARMRSNDFVITYVGGFGPHRGLDVAIRAMPHILKKVPPAKLVLVGEGSDKKEMEDLANSLGVKERVEFAGWVPLREVPKFILASGVCIIPHISNEHTETTIPHKLFQYMYMQKPVVVSDCRPLQRIVTETNSGEIFRSGDEADFARVIFELYHDEPRRRQIGENGRRAVINKYNWQNTSRSLIGLYASLSSRRNPHH